MIHGRVCPTQESAISALASVLQLAPLAERFRLAGVVRTPSRRKRQCVPFYEDQGATSSHLERCGLLKLVNGATM